MELVQIALDFAQGCRYLEHQHCIHRDLVTRNCLVSSKGADRVVKIDDFGLAKDLYSQDYEQVRERDRLYFISLHCVGERTEEVTSTMDGTRGLIESDIW